MLRQRPDYKQLIFSNVSDYNIFNKYFGPFEIGKCYPSAFRRDIQPSTGFYISKTNKIIYNDFAFGTKLDSIQFVAKLFNIGYCQAMLKIIEDFDISEAGAEQYVPTPYVKEEILINIVPRELTENDKTYFNSYWINKQELTRYNIYSVAETLIKGKKIKTGDSELKYAFILKDEEADKEYVKIYSPFSEKFKWISNIPLALPYGLKDLDSTVGKTLVLTKSLKDMIVLRKLTSNVIGLQNESLAALRDEDFYKLKDTFERIVVFFDNDEAGRRASQAMCEKFNIEEVFIPERALKIGIKDPSDYIKKFGLKELNKLYRWLINK